MQIVDCFVIENRNMEVDKRSRSQSKTKEKERKDESKSRKSTERTKVEEKPREKERKSEVEKKKTRSKDKESSSKHKNDKVEEDAKKKRSKDADRDKDRKSKKSENHIKPAEPIDKPKKPSSAKRREPLLSSPRATTAIPEPQIKNEVPKRPPSSRKTAVPPPDEDYNYEDDFEDYEDDFEEEEEEKLPENHQSDQEGISRPEPAKLRTSASVIEGENSDQSDVSTSRAATAASDRSVEMNRPKTVQSRINFQRAHVTEAQLANYGKMRGRAKELLQMIELDTVSYHLFDMAPVRDYEFFMQNFGKSNMIQAQVQTGDDSIERDGQTDEIDAENKWTQNPPTDMYGCGGDQAVNEDDARTRLKFDSELLNSLRFRRFVERGGTLISELLSDEYVSQEPSFQAKSSMSFSSACSTITLGPLAKRCKVETVSFADSQPTVVAVVFYVHESPLEDITGKTLITIWNITDLAMPFKLLICDGQSQTCCFSPDRPAAIFAGLGDGSLVSWDLQESESLHTLTIPWKDTEITLRQPTYDSAFLCKEQKNETSPVVAVTALNSAGKSSSGQASAATVDSYQLISLHGDGSIRIWTALMTLSKEPSELDLGLRPGGRLKLIQSTTLKPPLAALRNICGDTMLKTNDVDAYCLGWSTERQSDFYVGTGAGYILHLTRHEGKAGPSVYQPDLEALTDVLCISFSPFEPSVLLTGCSDGCIRVYKSSYSRPLATLSLPSTFKEADTPRTAPVRLVQWSPVSPYRLYSLHGNSILVTWDLKLDRQAPLTIEKCPKPLVAFRISAAAALGSGPANFMALPYQDGLVEIHQMKAEGGKTKYSKSDGAKLLRLVEML